MQASTVKSRRLLTLKSQALVTTGLLLRDYDPDSVQVQASRTLEYVDRALVLLIWLGAVLSLVPAQ
jgi:hypothetical protein